MRREEEEKESANFQSPRLPSSAMTMKEGNDGRTDERQGGRETGSLQLARRITRLCLSPSLTALSSPEGIMVNI